MKPGSEVVCVRVCPCGPGVISIGCQKMLLVEDGKIKVVESRGVIGCQKRCHCVA